MKSLLPSTLSMLFGDDDFEVIGSIDLRDRMEITTQTWLA